MNFWVQWGPNINTLPSWKLLDKKSSLPRNWNHSIWINLAQDMTQTLKVGLVANQNRELELNSKFRAQSTII